MASSSTRNAALAKKATAISTSGSKITATSEQSRFHVDTLETLSREIDLKTVNLSVGHNDLLSDAHLKLKSGVHYALSGRNGEGKSVLLQAISDKLIPGIQENIRILLVTQIVDDASSPLDLTTTESVLRSDVLRDTAVREHELLSKALTDYTPVKVSEAIAFVLLSRARRELELSQKIAIRRSGARGAEARKQLLIAESRVMSAEMRLDGVKGGDVGATDASEASAMLAELDSTLEVMGASTAEARARTILLGLGFTTAQLDAKVSTLSGGWRSRSSLAGALLQTPDILMLDEPTNYLGTSVHAVLNQTLLNWVELNVTDVLSVIWLQEYLNSYPTTLVLVAHDRDFVDAITQELIVLRHRTLTYHDGNLSDYERHMRDQRKNLTKQKDAMDRKKDAIVKTIDQAQRNSKKTGDDNLAKLAKSRQRKLDERWGVERSAKGGRFKLNRDFGGYALTSRAEIEIDQADREIRLFFPDPEPLRFPGALISATNITFAYPGRSTSSPVLQEVSMTIHPGSRTALLGRNGEGKSTLVKLLVGQLSLPKGSGTIERHSRLRLGYFDQHSVEKLSTAIASKNSGLVHFINTLKSENGIDVEEGAARQALGSFGLGGRKSTDPIAGLSGGQKVRLALAMIVYTAPDLLVLDEPSTHLDIDTIRALIYALRRYTGAILLVSHDRHFVRCVVEGAPILQDTREDPDSSDTDYNDDKSRTGGNIRDAGRVFAVGPKGRVKLLGGGVDAYTDTMERKMKKLGLGV